VNEVYNELRGPMSQFWIVETAISKYLVTWSKEWNWKWGFTRVLRELPR